ncbi:MAG: carbohydrate binding domain-containing protein [Candidatus Omnitrophica bacterium]|nr:carbohydrate binding domain-containing protein [Candidatus Omnitrophota bacterium]
MDEWYPFYFPEKLDPNSPLNIGKLVLDPPAGKHGFVKVKDGHFYFEDGTRAKFWGTNLCMSACFPTHLQAEMLANRIAYFGFNAVRLAHLDYSFEPGGIFEDICPAYKNPQMKKTGTLSRKQLDNLDYFIYQLKQRGIYVDFILLCSRFFTEADGIVDGEKLGMAAKPASMFDKKLIELQKKFAKNLLTHYNPYTKLRYCDDPTIALLEITNENSIIQTWKNNNLNGSIFGANKNALPEYYVKQLDNLWNAWLKERYKTVENVKTAWASPSLPTTNSSNVLNESGWSIGLHNDAKATQKINGNETIINILNITDTSWHVNYRHMNINVIKNKNYVFKFAANAHKPLKMSVAFQQSYSPWINLGLAREIEINKDFQRFEIPFTASDNCENAKITLSLGYDTGIVTLKDMEFYETDTIDLRKTELSDFRFDRPLYAMIGLYPRTRIQDIKAFYADIEKCYFDEMVLFLKKDIGIKTQVTGIGGYDEKDDIETQAECDFIDTHAYWDHPSFPNKSWDMNDFRIQNKSILLDPNMGIIGTIKTRQPINKPYTITEWNHCYPNQYAYESPVIMAAKAVENNWDGLFQFAFSHGWTTGPSFDEIHGNFDIMQNSQKLALCSIGSLLYFNSDNVDISVNNGVANIKSPFVKGEVGTIKGKTIEIGLFTIYSSDNGAIFLYSLDSLPIEHSKRLGFVTIGEIKNKGGGQNNASKFIWGSTPALLKKMGISINPKLSKTKLKIYELGNTGARKKEVKYEHKQPIALPSSPCFEIETE